MRRPWFKARPVDEGFFETAPLILCEAFEVPFPAERVWGELTSDEPLDWCRILQAIDWTSPRRSATRVANPLNKALLGTLFTDTRKHYGIHQ